jgi:RNA polymerase sigma factor (sigma-70 family)
VGTCAVAATKDSAPGMGLSAEIDLVCRAKEGDEQAFAALFQQNKKRVYSLCLLMTGDASQAEDLTQDSFIQVFRRLDTFRGEAAFSTWLYRVAVNTVLMTLRKHQPRQVSLDEPVRVESSLVPREFGRGDPRLLGAIDRIALAPSAPHLRITLRTSFDADHVDRARCRIQGSSYFDILSDKGFRLLFTIQFVCHTGCLVSQDVPVLGFGYLPHKRLCLLLARRCRRLVR